MRTEAPRVLHVDTAREWRGGQAQLLHLVQALEAGRPGSQAVALPADAVLAERLRGAVRVLPVPFRGELRGTSALARAIRAFDPDLVAAHTSHAHGHAVRATRRPVLVHRRVDFRPGRHPLSRWKYRSATGFIAVSQAVADILVRAGVPPERIRVVYDGVDTDPLDAASADRAGLRAELGLPPGRRLVLAVGALVAHKGHRHLVEAMAGLDATCVIAGEGPLRGALSRQAEVCGADVRLVGQRHDVPRLLRSVDVFCHPSVEEGLGQAVIEAVIAGVPVVATRAGGIPEILPVEQLVQPADGDALAAALRDPPRFDEDRARARFGLGACVRETVAAWRALGGLNEGLTAGPGFAK